MNNQYDWVLYPGSYVKQFYDVRLRDGQEWIECWPNAGYFTNMKTGETVHENQVEYCRATKDEDLGVN